MQAHLTHDHPLCRPAAWACLWREMGGTSVLNRKAASLP